MIVVKIDDNILRLYFKLMRVYYDFVFDFGLFPDFFYQKGCGLDMLVYKFKQ